MSEAIPIRLDIQEPDKDIYSASFEKDVIKIGRGSRKGIDVSMEDKKVSRMHAVINVGKKGDVFIMNMGSGTKVDGKDVMARTKLTSGVELALGKSTITVWIGDDIPAPVVADGSATDDNLDAISISGDEFDYEIESEHSLSEDGLDSLTHDGLPNANVPPEHVPILVGFQPGENYNVFPMHAEGHHSYGFYGPPPSPLPEQATGPSMDLLMDVVNRLAKESWMEHDSLNN